MAIIRKREIHEMDSKSLEQKLFELRKELNSEKGMVAGGGRSQNPGRIRELRKTIARILTILSRREDLKKGEKEEIKRAAPSKKADAKK
ncbi:MAG: 50S ribosomal protein L29 [Candidatus Micrarchaeota archaeon]